MNRIVLTCNLREAISEASKGARCYVVQHNRGNASDRMELLIRSRSGRWILKWESLSRLTNFRWKPLPPEHPRYGDERLIEQQHYPGKENFAEWINKLSDQHE